MSIAIVSRMVVVEVGSGTDSCCSTTIVQTSDQTRQAQRKQSIHSQLVCGGTNNPRNDGHNRHLKLIYLQSNEY